MHAQRKRRFYSHSVALTLQQIQWLQNRLNASQLLRWLIEGAMATDDLDDKCETIQSLEMRIGNIERRIREKKQRNMEIYEELKAKRRKAIASLIETPSNKAET